MGESLAWPWKLLENLINRLPTVFWYNEIGRIRTHDPYPTLLCFCCMTYLNASNAAMKEHQAANKIHDLCVLSNLNRTVALAPIMFGGHRRRTRTRNHWRPPLRKTLLSPTPALAAKKPHIFKPHLMLSRSVVMCQPIKWTLWKWIILFCFVGVCNFEKMKTKKTWLV